MSCLRNLRLWTAIIVIALAGSTMLAAGKLVAFGLVDYSAEAQGLVPFLDDAMVGSMAEARLLELDRSADDGARRERLERLLSRAPLSGGAWLALAAARFESDEPVERVESALAMSSLVAPNEGRLMGDRAVFAIPLWPRLSAASRRRIVADLLGGWEGTPGRERETLTSIVYLTPGETKEEMRSALFLSGAPGEGVAAELGLSPASNGGR